MNKIAFVYPGQGCQAPGMGKDLYTHFPIARTVFERAGKALNMDIAQLCFDGSMEDLSRTENTQPAILTVAAAMTEILKSRAILPSAVAGLSLGEYAALVAAGSLSLEEGVQLVRTRGLLMQNEVPEGQGGLLAVVGMKSDEIEHIIDPLKTKGVISCSNYNAPDQTVVGGTLELLHEAAPLLKEGGARMAKLLNVSAPFHTQMLHGAGKKLRPHLEQATILRPFADYYPNTLGARAEEESNIAELLEQQVYTPVRWEQSIRAMIADGVDTFIEVYPGKTVASLIKKIDPSVSVVTLSTLEELEAFLAEWQVEQWAV